MHRFEFRMATILRFSIMTRTRAVTRLSIQFATVIDWPMRVFRSLITVSAVTIFSLFDDFVYKNRFQPDNGVLNQKVQLTPARQHLKAA